MSESSDGYSEDFDEDIHSDPDTRHSFHHKKARQRTPALLLNKPEGRIQEMTMGVKNRQVGNRGANSLPILGRGRDRLMDPNPLKVKKRMVSQDGRKPPNDKVLSANLRTIRSLQSALKEKEMLTEQLVKENRLYKRFDILAQKEVFRIEREHKNLPELIKRHETELTLQREKYKKVMKENSDITRRKEHLEKELVHCKVRLAELKKISEDKKLEEREMLNQRLQEELNRNQHLSLQLQEAERKLAFQDKSVKREKAELEDRCKKKEKRIILMEKSIKEIDSQMRTKRKQLEKLNIYSLRIEKNLPPNMNISDLFIPQEDRSTMTSPSLPTQYQLSAEREEAPFEEQQYAIPSTLSHAHSSQSTNFTRTSYQVGQFHNSSPPTQISELNGLPNKRLYSTISPPMTHSEPGNYSESETTQTLHNSSGLTSLNSYHTPFIKSPQQASDVTSPPSLAPPDPPLSTIKEISTSPSKTHTTRSSLPQTNTQHVPTSIPTHHSTQHVPTSIPTHHNTQHVSTSIPTHHSTQHVSTSIPTHHSTQHVSTSIPTHHNTQHVSTSIPTHHSTQHVSTSIPTHHNTQHVSTSIPTHHNTQHVSTSIPTHHSTQHVPTSIPTHHNTHTDTDTLSIEATKKEMLLQKLKQIDLKESSSTNQSTNPVDSLASSAREPEKQLDSLDIQTRRLPQQDNSSNDTTNQSDSIGSRSRKKTFALDDLFSGSPQGSSSQLLGSSDMDPNLFSAPKPESPLFFSKDKQANKQYQQHRKDKREEVPKIQQDTSNRTNHTVAEDTQELGRKQSVVENMFQGKPAYSTEDDFYGAKFRKTSPNKSPHPFQSELDTDRKPQHGRRAKETNSPPLLPSEESYYWENSVTTSKPGKQRAPPPVPVDDLDDDLEEVILL